MRERPILFSGPMVRAILDGRKTQTRRAVKLTDAGHAKETCGNRRWHPADPEARLACPYGVPGDRLWVRETWALFLPAQYNSHVNDWSDVMGWPAPIPNEHPRGRWDLTYAATDADKWPDAREERGFAWRPSIHMPRWASRLTLDVVSVRVERLQDISEADAIAEGVGQAFDDFWIDYVTRDTRPCLVRTARESFCTLWSSINGAASWDANPWVWVVEFAKAGGGR